jgi:adenosylmethionine-8-amino-7-oxononanoate aminotransferase
MADDTARSHDFGPLEKQALEHIWIHSARWLDLAERDGLRVLVRGEGSTLWDARGKAYLDGLAGLYLVNVGHGRREIGDAMAEQATQLAYASSASYTNLAAVKLTDVLAGLTPGDLNRFFLCSGGSEAIESAMKIAKQVQAMRGFPKRYKIIARRGGYHGATMGAMSITSSRNEKFFGPFMYGVSFVPSPNRYRNDFGIDGEAGDLACANAIEQEILAQGPDTVAAVVGEPVSTANNCHVPSREYWQRVREICDKHGVLLILDEVINGFGPDRHDVRDRAVRRRPRPHDHGQGAVVGLCPDRRGRGQRTALRGVQEAGRGARPSPHLWRPGGVVRGGAQEHRDPRARRAAAAQRPARPLSPR